jgi:aspartyl-tRNA(Asn)/glutamyl-tRNA(Gln) amidotransferase subunit C
MSLSLDDVKRIANLACIEISTEEADAAQAQLSDIFDLIQEMQAADTSAIQPLAYTEDVTQRLRDDVVTEPDQRELFQSLAPQVEMSLYLVPKVIE